MNQCGVNLAYMRYDGATAKTFQPSHILVYRSSVFCHKTGLR